MTVVGDIQKHYNQIFSAERKVADFILNNPEQVVQSNVSELASLSGVSDATVIRLCKHIGYEGYYQMKLLLSHDLGRSQMGGLGKDNGDKPKTAVDFFNIVANNMISLGKGVDMSVLASCVELLLASKLTHVVAAGNTSPLASDLAFRLGRLGLRATSSMVPEYFLSNIVLADSAEVLVGISHSGTSKVVLQAFSLAKEEGLKTIAICTSANSPLSKVADLTLLSPGNDRIFAECGITSHIFEFAIMDLLLYFIANHDCLYENIDQVEMMLSEYKL